MQSEYEVRRIKVSEKCQITIPTDIQRKTGIKRGDKLIVFSKDSQIFLQKEDKVAKKINDDFEDMRMSAEHSLSKFWKDEPDGLWEQYL